MESRGFGQQEGTAQRSGSNKEWGKNFIVEVGEEIEGFFFLFYLFARVRSGAPRPRGSIVKQTF